MLDFICKNSLSIVGIIIGLIGICVTLRVSKKTDKINKIITGINNETVIIKEQVNWIKNKGKENETRGN